MTRLDALPIVLVVVDAALGLFTGRPRRRIGLIALLHAFLGPTNRGARGGGHVGGRR